MSEGKTIKPILVSGSTARRLIDCRPTKYHALVKAGLIETVTIAGRRMVVYESLEALAKPDTKAA